MGIKHLEHIPIHHKGKVRGIGELSRKDHIRLEAVLLKENAQLKHLTDILLASNQKLRGQTTYLRKKLREKMP